MSMIYFVETKYSIKMIMLHACNIHAIKIRRSFFLFTYKYFIRPLLNLFIKLQYSKLF